MKTNLEQWKTMKTHPEPWKTMKNQLGTTKNQPGTIKNHENRPTIYVCWLFSAIKVKSYHEKSFRLWNGVAWLPMLTVDYDLVLTLNCEPNRPSFVLKRKQPPNPTNKQIWIVRSTIVTSPNKTFPGVQLLLLTRPQQPLKTVDIQTSTAMLPEMATFQTRTTVGSTGTALGKGRAPKKNEHF